tara:strand:- start:816 stop:1220 length:405 start_codon:yes stop_codon:yes gene_type:complete
VGRKPKERKYVKPTDGRKNNGRKRGEKVNKPIVATPSALNKAKKARVHIYALNAMKEVFGSEEKAWESLAEKAKDSFPHLKLLFEYKYGKPEDVGLNEGKPKVNINIKNLFAGNQDDENPDIIDVTEEDNGAGE